MAPEDLSGLGADDLLIVRNPSIRASDARAEQPAASARARGGPPGTSSFARSVLARGARTAADARAAAGCDGTGEVPLPLPVKGVELAPRPLDGPAASPKRERWTGSSFAPLIRDPAGPSLVRRRVRQNVTGELARAGRRGSSSDGSLPPSTPPSASATSSRVPSSRPGVGPSPGPSKLAGLGSEPSAQSLPPPSPERSAPDPPEREAPAPAPPVAGGSDGGASSDGGGASPAQPPRRPSLSSHDSQASAGSPGPPAARADGAGEVASLHCGMGPGARVPGGRPARRRQGGTLRRGAPSAGVKLPWGFRGARSPQRRDRVYAPPSPDGDTFTYSRRAVVDLFSPPPRRAGAAVGQGPAKTAGARGRQARHEFLMTGRRVWRGGGGPAPAGGGAPGGPGPGGGWFGPGGRGGGAAGGPEGPGEREGPARGRRGRKRSGLRSSLGRGTDLSRIPENEVATVGEEEIEQQIEMLASEPSGAGAPLAAGAARGGDWPWQVTLSGVSPAEGEATPPCAPGAAVLSKPLIEAWAETADASLIEVVDLSGRGLEDVDPRGLTSLLELKELLVGDNALPDLACLSSLYCLQTLIIPLNMIAAVGPLREDAFLRLSFLDASYNRLDGSALPPLGDLPSLAHLDLSGNDLGPLPDPVGGFPALRKLVLCNCGLDGQALLPLGPLPRLSELYLGDNRIAGVPRGIDVARDYPALAALDLSNNQISQAHHVDHLRGLPSLEKVYMLGNPLEATLGRARGRGALAAGGKLAFRAETPQTPATAEMAGRAAAEGAPAGRVATPNPLDPRLAVGVSGGAAPGGRETDRKARQRAARKAGRRMGGVFKDAMRARPGERRKSDPFLGMEVLGEMTVDEVTGRVESDWGASGAMVAVPHDRILMAFSRIHHVVEKEARATASRREDRGARAGRPADNVPASAVRGLRSSSPGLMMDAAEAALASSVAQAPAPTVDKAGNAVTNPNHPNHGRGLFRPELPAAAFAPEWVGAAGAGGGGAGGEGDGFSFPVAASPPPEAASPEPRAGDAPALSGGPSPARRPSLLDTAVLPGAAGGDGVRRRGRTSNLVDGLDGVGSKRGSMLEPILSTDQLSGSLSDLGPSSSQAAGLALTKDPSGMFGADGGPQGEQSAATLESDGSFQSVFSDGDLDSAGDGLLGPEAWSTGRADREGSSQGGRGTSAGAAGGSRPASGASDPTMRLLAALGAPGREPPGAAREEKARAASEVARRLAAVLGTDHSGRRYVTGDAGGPAGRRAPLRAPREPSLGVSESSRAARRRLLAAVEQRRAAMAEAAAAERAREEERARAREAAERGLRKGGSKSVKFSAAGPGRRAGFVDAGPGEDGGEGEGAGGGAAWTALPRIPPRRRAGGAGGVEEGDALAGRLRALGGRLDGLQGTLIAAGAVPDDVLDLPVLASVRADMRRITFERRKSDTLATSRSKSLSRGRGKTLSRDLQASAREEAAGVARTAPVWEPAPSREGAGGTAGGDRGTGADSRDGAIASLAGALGSRRGFDVPGDDAGDWGMPGLLRAAVAGTGAPDGPGSSGDEGSGPLMSSPVYSPLGRGAGGR